MNLRWLHAPFSVLGKTSRILCLATLITSAAAHAQNVAGTLSSTVSATTGTIDGCANVFQQTWTWKFTDPSGGVHTFPYYTETLQQRGRVPCQPTVTTVLDEWSSDNLYYLEATGPSGQVTQAAAIGSPLYKVVSILYDPPGNRSSAGFTDSVSDGTTNTIGSSFTDATNITFNYGFSDIASGSLSFGESASTSSSEAFTETFSNASGVSLSNSQTSNTINHNFDTFLIWLNPQVTVVTNGVNPVSYSVGVQPLANGTTPNPDIVEITANAMENNGSGKTQVPAAFLNQQYNAGNGTYTPGLAHICKNLIVAEYNAHTCTLADQCGCAPSDFAPILALDPLLSYASTTSPLNADASGATACASPNGSTNCRYVPVTTSPTNSTQVVKTLSGPDLAGDPDPCNQFTASSSTSTSQTLGGSTSESVGASFKYGPGIGFSVTVANTLTWTQDESTGTATGTGYSESVNFCSATVGCGQNIPLYQDTVFHTFVYQQPSGNNSCP